MPPKSIFAFALALFVALSVAMPTARAQAIEQLVGSWIYLAYGNCGVYGCFNGPMLCAVIHSSAGISWCYER